MGIGGRTVAKILAFDLEHVRSLQPDIVILEIGSNDFCEVGQRPETVGSSIESLVSTFHEVYNVAFIVVCQVIHRATLPSHSPQYNSSVNILNNYLEVVLDPLSLSSGVTKASVQAYFKYFFAKCVVADSQSRGRLEREI